MPKMFFLQHMQSIKFLAYCYIKLVALGLCLQLNTQFNLEMPASDKTQCHDHLSV